MRRALYAGTFDPVTLGHLDLVERGVRLFPSLVVGIGDNSRKEPLFPADERAAMVRAEVKRRRLKGVTVAVFQGLAVDFARERGAEVLLRGVRTAADFEAEYPMALTNRALAGNIETVFVMPSEPYAYLSSSLIREVVRHGGDVSRWVSPAVARALRKKLARVR
jgi:pantetheine-phosphate adenylyltransferase